MHPIDKERVDELCREMRRFFDAELAVGNHIVETWKGWPHKDSLYGMLAVHSESSTRACSQTFSFARFMIRITGHEDQNSYQAFIGGRGGFSVSG